MHLALASLRMDFAYSSEVIGLSVSFKEAPAEETYEAEFPPKCLTPLLFLSILAGKDIV
jgi:hypothetical protein